MSFSANRPLMQTIVVTSSDSYPGFDPQMVKISWNPCDKVLLFTIHLFGTYWGSVESISTSVARPGSGSLYKFMLRSSDDQSFWANIGLDTSKLTANVSGRMSLIPVSYTRFF
jgi:hypothetical protein